MRSTLFRPESHIPKQNDWFGTVILLQPLSLRLFSWTVILIALCAITFMYFAEYTKRVPATGMLVPDLGLITVQSPQSGLVIERRVQEGQRVKAGEVLYVLTSESMFAGGSGENQLLGLTSTTLDQLKKRQIIIQTDSSSTLELAEKEKIQAKAKIESLQSELLQLEQETIIQSQRLESKERQYESNVLAHKQGFISAIGLQQKHDELLDQKARLSGTQRSQISLKRELEIAQMNLATLKNKQVLNRSQFDRQILDVEQDRVFRESTNKMLVTAPQSGVVAAILAEPGQRVNGQTLLAILPSNSELEAHLFVPSSLIGYLREGDEVEIHVSAFPFQKNGGIKGFISQVSDATTESLEQINGAKTIGLKDSPGGAYRVKVKLPVQNVNAFGRQNKLRSGMQVSAQITQDRRTLIEWVIEPLYKLRQKL